jgi:hypothetical protein
VNDPGGVFNIDALVAGALGSSATTYRGGNGVSGAGNYTLYYDAIEPVAFAFPLPPVPPVPPVPPLPPIIPFDFTFSPFGFSAWFDAFERDTEDRKDGTLGDEESLFGSLGLFESDEDAHSESNILAEEALDSLFGPRNDRFSEGELDEEERRRRERARRKVGPIGNASYVYYPGTSRYSSLRIFGAPLRGY